MIIHDARRGGPVLLGKPAPRQLAAALERALQPMIKQVRATLPKIESKQDAKRLGAALRRTWSDGRIRELVQGIGKRGEEIGSQVWVRSKLTPEDLRKRRKDTLVLDAEGPRLREYDGAKLVAVWVKEATSRITSVRDEVAEGMQRDIAEALAKDIPPERLAAKWRKQGIPVEWGTLEGRTKVIAQHQLSNLHAEVQRTRATAVGVEDFTWRALHDGHKIRPLHRELDGKQFPYAQGHSSEGLPGQPINCYCYAESVISDAFLQGFGIEGLIEA